MSWWTKDREEKLKSLWRTGHSGSSIAKILGNGATRNSVLGKSFRLKLEARVISKKSKLKSNTEKDNFPEINTQKLGRKGKFRALLLSKDFPEENPTPLGELNDNHCKYPLGPKLEPAKFFCGRKPVQKDGGRYPYCELHLLVSYVSRNEKEEDSIADEDIPKFLEQRVKKVKSA